MDLITSSLVLVAALLFARYFGGLGVGAPFLPIRRNDIRDALTLVEIGPQDVVVDLGSGDGRVLEAAAERGARVVGYEINPLLVWISRRRLRRFGERVQVFRKNLLAADLSHATVVFIFGIDKLMPKIRRMLEERGQPGLKIVSFVFNFPGWQPVTQQGVAKLYHGR